MVDAVQQVGVQYRIRPNLTAHILAFRIFNLRLGNDLALLTSPQIHSCLLKGTADLKMHSIVQYLEAKACAGGSLHKRRP